MIQEKTFIDICEILNNFDLNYETSNELIGLDVNTILVILGRNWTDWLEILQTGVLNPPPRTVLIYYETKPFQIKHKNKTILMD